MFWGGRHSEGTYTLGVPKDSRQVDSSQDRTRYQ